MYVVEPQVTTHYTRYFISTLQVFIKRDILPEKRKQIEVTISGLTGEEGIEAMNILPRL